MHLSNKHDLLITGKVSLMVRNFNVPHYQEMFVSFTTLSI